MTPFELKAAFTYHIAKTGKMVSFFQKFLEEIVFDKITHGSYNRPRYLKGVSFMMTVSIIRYGVGSFAPFAQG